MIAAVRDTASLAWEGLCLRAAGFWLNRAHRAREERLLRAIDRRVAELIASRGA